MKTTKERIEGRRENIRNEIEGRRAISSIDGYNIAKDAPRQSVDDFYLWAMSDWIFVSLWLRIPSRKDTDVIAILLKSCIFHWVIIWYEWALGSERGKMDGPMSHILAQYICLIFYCLDGNDGWRWWMNGCLCLWHGFIMELKETQYWCQSKRSQSLCFVWFFVFIYHLIERRALI